ncbi:MAG: hypothetical protein ACR2PH_06680 [Desulfobulbia bacterium]
MASLNSDEATFEINEEPQNITAAQLTTDQRIAGFIGSMNLEYRLCDI